jgi:hypothetical protein
MMFFGPVSNAAHGGRVDPWFSIAVGGAVLIATWTKYLKGELRRDTHLGTLLGISAICSVFIATAVWELLH